MSHDVIVVGGSYAGMSAALQLVRARRRVLVIDAGRRRNRFAAHAHGFLGQDGADPAEIARQARAQLMAYPTLAWEEVTATGAEGAADGFVVTLDDGTRREARRLILATGVVDELPAIPGLGERWGRSVFHCPYCHGYELDGGPVGVIATGPASLHQAQLLREWGPVTLFLNGRLEPAAEERFELERRGVTVETAAVAGVRGAAEVLLEDGRSLSFAGLFTAPWTQPASGLAEDLGCEMEETPTGRLVSTDALKQTSVPGVAACGDVARPAHSVALAVGDGALAGFAVHRSLVF